MALDYPNTPSVGDIFNSARWDGAKWTGVAATDAPADANYYGRHQYAWAQVLPLTGGTLSGSLTLPAADPTTAAQATTKSYSDHNKTSTSVNLTPGSQSLTVAQCDAAVIFCYGSPTGPVTITLPVATTIRNSWTIFNHTSQPVTFQGTSGGTVVVPPPSGSQMIWTDTAGIYPLNNSGQTRAAGDNSLFLATTAFCNGYLPITGGVISGSLGVSAAIPSDTTVGVVYATDYSMPLGGNLGFNAYSATAGWKRLAAAPSGLFTFDTSNNVWNWFCAPTGAAGSAISWTQVATMDHSGNLNLVTGQLLAPHGAMIGNGAPINDPLSVGVAQGYNARTMYNVANVRLWSCGTFSSGNFAIGDETGAATVLQLFMNGGGQLTGNLACASVSGGVSGGGTLATTNSHTITFGWADQVANSITAYVDSTANAFALCTQTNASKFSYASGGGGPAGVSLNGYDQSSNFYGIFVDASSDARIKDNVAPTDVDALAALLNVPITQFDIKADAAAWIGATGKSIEERDAMMRDAQPAHVPIGMVAQEVQPIIAEAVGVLVNPDPPPDSPLPPDMHHLIDASFTPYVIRAIQQLAARLAAVEAR
jgi:hypothetical protein